MWLTATPSSVNVLFAATGVQHSITILNSNFVALCLHRMHNVDLGPVLQNFNTIEITFNYSIGNGQVR